MADRTAVRFLEGVYARVDGMVRAIVDSWPDALDAYTINIQFDGGGVPLVAGMKGQVEIPISGRLVAARIFLGTGDTASSATVHVQIGTFEAYPTGVMLHGAGATPALSSATKAELVTTDWVKTFTTGEIMAYTLNTFSGSAQNLTLALRVRKLPEIHQPT